MSDTNSNANQQTKPIGDLIAAFFSKLWQFVVKYPVLLIVATVLIGVGLALKSGQVKFNLGGLLGKLFGTDTSDRLRDIEVVNTPPAERKDSKGNPIPVGVPDDRGYTQWKQKEIIVDNNPLRDTSVVKVKDENGNVKKIELPVGVDDKQVETIIEVKPNVHVVKVTDSSGIQPNKLKNVASNLP